MLIKLALTDVPTNKKPSGVESEHLETLLISGFRNSVTINYVVLSSVVCSSIPACCCCCFHYEAQHSGAIR